MSDHELKRESKRALRAVMREMDRSVRFDTPEELEVLRGNFEAARKRSLQGLLAGGGACGLGWRYTMGKRFSPLVTAWGAMAGMTIGLFSVRHKLFLDLLSIPEDRSPFATRARQILEKEIPRSSLLDEIKRRRRERFPRPDDSGYDEVIWTEPPPSSVDQFKSLDDFDTAGQAARDRREFPGTKK